MASDSSDSDASSVDLLAPVQAPSTKRDPSPNEECDRPTTADAKRPKHDSNVASSVKTNESEESTIPNAIVPQLVPSNANWVVRRDCLLVRKDIVESPPRTKAAAFDMDGTLLIWRCAGWPSRPEHYELWSTQVISKLRHLYDNDGYQLVIYSNQGGIRSAVTGKTATRIKGLIDWLASTIDRPLLAVVSTSTKSGYHKPDCKMWEVCEQECNGGVEFQPEHCIYVGDSDGNSQGNDAYQELGVDKVFAENVGKRRGVSLKFYTPQDFFGESDSARRKEARLLFGGEYDAPPREALKCRAALLGGYLQGPILLILCGAQGSGKSYFCRELLDDGNDNILSWVHLSQDTINNGKPGKREKVEQAAMDALTKENLSVVIDRMHLDAEQRSHFIKVAHAAHVPVHALLLNPPKSELEKRVRERTDHPGGVQGDAGAKLAVASLEKLVAPTYSEGLALVSVVSSVNEARVICDQYRRVLITGSKTVGEVKSSSLPRSFPLRQCIGKNPLALPSIALGTQKVGKKVASAIVSSAVNKGFEAVDTAPTYNNEKEVGCGLPKQDECFVIVKVPKRVTQPSQAREEILGSLEKLGRITADLALLHWPCDLIEAGTLAAVWEQLEELVVEGRVRSLGVSNFSIDALRVLFPMCKVARPVVNQIERHPLLPQWELLDYCMNHGIVVQAHTALGQGRNELLHHPTVDKIVQERNGSLTSAQVIIQWNLQQGAAVVVKCSSESNLGGVVRVLRDDTSSLCPDEMNKLDAICNDESDQIRFVVPPFMYKHGVPYSWGDRAPSKQR